MKVYVVYDPLFEKVVCVHEEPDMECDLCDKEIDQRIQDNKGYYFEEHERELVPSKSEIRDRKIDDIVNE